MSYQFIQEALLEAKKSPMTAKYGAVLVYRNRIISKGYNTYKPPISNSSRYCLLRG